MNLLKQNKDRAVVIILILLSIPSIFALFHAGFFVSDDGEWMVIRFAAFYHALRDGQFPVRFLSQLNHGYGYPVANFLYPGFMYLGVLIHILGFGFVTTIKIIFGLSLVSSALFFYWWLRNLFSIKAACMGALFYLYAPYHLYDVYKRGSVGEVLSLAIIPFVLWQIERNSFFWVSIGIAALILSHNTLAFLFIPFLVIYVLIRSYPTKTISSKPYAIRIINTMIPFLLGVGLSAFFWFPALYDLQYTVFSKTAVSNWQEYFPAISLIGFLTFLILLLSLLQKKKDGQKNKFFWLFFIVTCISLFFVLPISSLLWQILPISFIQFPFRLLSVTILGTAYLVGFLINHHLKNEKYTVPLLGVLILFQAYPYVMPQAFTQKEEGFYTTNQDTTTVKNEYMPFWVKSASVMQSQQKVETIEETGATISNVQTKSNFITFNFKATEKTPDPFVQINTVYFPGWKAKLNKSAESPPIIPNENGLIRFRVPTMSQKDIQVRVFFSETTERLWADMVSIISIILLFILRFSFIKRGF